MATTCPHCKCTKIEVEPVRGDAICTSCGTVLSEHNIVSEIQFLDNNKGGSTAVGQFVSTDAISKRTNFTRSYQGVFTRESKEITLGNAYKRIKGLSQQLRLNSFCIETSFNFFKLALSKGLTKGRKNSLIVGACVYITCRTELTAHMLIDVSDALQIDVYELGRTYLRLSTALCITIPAMDPCLYIWRFAHKLSFGDNTHEVSETALRLVKRMKRDWMHTGRRPSGLCGAALVIAARLHNFNRTVGDVIKVVKVHESTLRKRLNEFGETPSSALTPDQFMKEDLDEEQDPPAFKAARKKEQERVQALLSDQENLDDEITEIQREIEKHLAERRKKLRGIWAKYEEERQDEEINNEKETICTQQFITDATLETINNCLNENGESSSNADAPIAAGLRPSAASLGLKDTIEECMEIRTPVPTPEVSEVLDLTDIDDVEIDSYIMSEREIKLKTDLWTKLNQDYLDEMRLKEEREREEEERRVRDGEPPPKKKKTYKKRAKSSGPANTAGEAIERMLQDKKLSNKINYDVLRNLNGETDASESNSMTPMDRPSPAPTPNLPETNEQEPDESQDKIQSILHSLATRRTSKSESPERAFVLPDKIDPTPSAALNDSIDDEDEEEEENEDEGGSIMQMLRKRRGDNDSDEYDDYD